VLEKEEVIIFLMITVRMRRSVLNEPSSSVRAA
jgi:hypothetical protein